VTETFTQLHSILESRQRFLLTTHLHPDADGLGSELALAAYLIGRGKEVHILNPTATPANCLFLDPHRRAEEFNPAKHEKLLASVQTIIVLDTNQTDRLDRLKPYVLASSAVKVCIDHHLSREEFANLYLIDEEAAATGEILARWLRAFDPHSITPEIAQNLYAAIMTDTGSFRFPKTDAELHRIVADLIDRGADPVAVYQKHYEQQSLGTVRLLARALASLTVDHNGMVAYMVLTRKDFAETSTTEADAHSFVAETLKVRGVRVGLLFTEIEGGLKISFRSKGNIPINELAQEFGGNGHKNAAGARIAGATLLETVPRVLQRCSDYLK